MSLPPAVSDRLSDVMDDIGVNERIKEKRKRQGLLKVKIAKTCKMSDVSGGLSDVLDDIGVNERIREKRKRQGLLKEKFGTVSDKKFTKYKMFYQFYFGSRTEGSTTIGLYSDTDHLIPLPNFNVVQSMTEEKPCDADLMMIQNENISPGYCHLQYIKPVQAIHTSASTNSIKHFVTVEGKLLLKNTFKTVFTMPYTTLNGPAFSDPIRFGFYGEDYVVCLICKSSPLQASSWCKKQTECTWPSEDVKKSCRNAGCFVVPVGSKVSKKPELEWRVSTCLQERHLMFSLNITQLRCYVLMKMVLNTYIKPRFEDILSSFMCKNVFFFCVANSKYEWHRESLLYNLHTCLQKLRNCVEQSNCPHFMIPENNLLESKMNDTERGQLLDILNKLMTNDEQLLFGIQIDDLGRRLKMKLNMISPYPNITSAEFISMRISSELLCDTAHLLTHNFNLVLLEINNESLEMAHQYFSQKHSLLNKYHIPLESSILGSVIAALYIKAYTAIPDEAFTYLEAGLESDALSGRLKLASVLYCTGDLERTENILRSFQELSDMLAVQSKCGCYDKLLLQRSEFRKASDNCNEERYTFYIAFCTLFLRCEINCVPHELRYELWRPYTGGRWKLASFEGKDEWMDLIAVDSIPYLFFLKYKVYRQRGERGEQQKALSNLAWTIKLRRDLTHKETALNLLGQCLEQENKESEAFASYISSLKHRLRNNAARLLTCIQLFKLRKKYNVL